MKEFDTSWSCQILGNSADEPLGDQEGRTMRVDDYVCVATAGPLSGAVDTGRGVSVFDKSGGTLVTGTGVIRTPDATAVYLITDQKFEFVLSHDKVVGVTSTGHARYVMAAGSAASISGKSSTITTRMTGPRQFVVEEKFD